MIPPCARLSTPLTPNISVKPMAPRPYSALTANPSIRICRASTAVSGKLRYALDRLVSPPPLEGGGGGRGRAARAFFGTTFVSTPPPNPSLKGRGRNVSACPRRRGWLVRGGLLSQLHERRENQLVRALAGRPDTDLLAVLPLHEYAGGEAGAVFQRMGELVLLAVELDMAERALHAGLLDLVDHLVRIGRFGALDRGGEDLHRVIGGEAVERGEMAEALLELLGHRDGLRGDRQPWHGPGLRHHAV